ncbi:predicted protein [Thalassiosira pseudonana CCMP1335]|uniref:Uncharacterized protein n=1 Tax=Thalassiosira pseudonana TaxID=35128 RepID=B8BUE9_THAPS|nr:predicted protein [Thalassiosira pseudonana CCMP1335]EED95275.1 predicted protein [Thalassiosira pseudonana CCMP1335]|eukprot:g10350.t1 g10350   contig4:1702309-1702869(+)
MEEVAASEIPDGFFLADPSGGPKQPSSTASDQAAQRDAQRQAVLEQAMTPDALARLRRVKLVKKDRASAVEAMIANMAMQGKLDCKISEGKLIEMLEGIHGAQQKKAGGDAGKISIQRKKYNFDSDDEDDNDDDLL